MVVADILRTDNAVRCGVLLLVVVVFVWLLGANGREATVDLSPVLQVVVLPVVVVGPLRKGANDGRAWTNISEWAPRFLSMT